jgi:uncharacterized protein YciI
MYAIAILRYRRPLEEVQVHQEAHRAYVRGLHERGVVGAGGPLDPRNGGAILFRIQEGAGLDFVDRIRDDDPYIKAGAVQYETLIWNPVIGGID